MADLQVLDERPDRKRFRPLERTTPPCPEIVASGEVFDPWVHISAQMDDTLEMEFTRRAEVLPCGLQHHRAFCAGGTSAFGGDFGPASHL